MDEISNLKKQINNLSLKCEGTQLEYEYVNNLKNNQISELQQRQLELLEENQTLKKKISEYENSTSWKITKPLRYLIDKCKK